MSDYIVRATAANSQIRAFAAVTTDMVETARKDHNTSPVATAALGRLLTGGAMMGAMMKGEKDLLTLRIHAGGPLQGITVTADSHGNVKGYVGNPDVCIPANSKGKLDVAGAVGVGFMDVIKDMGLKEPYVGQVALQTSEIAEDLTYYFATSEQVPSAVGLGVLMNKDNTVRQAGGFIVQLMPFAEEEDLLTVFKLVNNYLDPDGIFIFDMNTPYKYREMLGNTTIAENREEGSFIWENEFDEETGINVYDLTLFLPREDGLYERDEEIHYQKAYEPEKIRELLEKAGLIPLAVYDAYTKDAPKPDSGRLTFVAREHGKGISAEEK